MTIYYFSGTGNSLAVARDIAGKLGGELAPIASVADRHSIDIKDEKVGIVFPVYNHGIPYIVKRFLDNAGSLHDKYIFAVCTYGDHPCLANEFLDMIIGRKGGSLAGAFAVRMPYNYISPVFRLRGFLKSFTLRETPMEKQREMFKVWEKKLEDICEYIAAERTGTIETSMESLEHLVDRLNLRETLQKSVWLKIGGFNGSTELPYLESVQLMDHGFKADGNCTGCGTCGRICPAGDIKMEGGKPVWLHKCTQCFACLQWCPNEAIQFREGTTGRKRYHHPDIKLSDMLKQSVPQNSL